MNVLVTKFATPSTLLPKQCLLCFQEWSLQNSINVCDNRNSSDVVSLWFSCSTFGCFLKGGLEVEQLQCIATNSYHELCLLLMKKYGVDGKCGLNVENSDLLLLSHFQLLRQWEWEIFDMSRQKHSASSCIISVLKKSWSLYWLYPHHKRTSILCSFLCACCICTYLFWCAQAYNMCMSLSACVEFTNDNKSHLVLYMVIIADYGKLRHNSLLFWHYLC